MKTIGMKGLLGFMALISVCLAFLRDEPIYIAMASVTALLGIAASSALLIVTMSHLVKTVSQSIDEKSLLPFVSRIKWLVVDTVLLFLLLATIANCNYVFEQHTGGAGKLLKIAFFTIPLMAIYLVTLKASKSRWPRPL